jgi:hypothetical protein
MKVIIAGGRNFSDYEKLKSFCDEILSDNTGIEIVSGKASGADNLGEQYAKEKGYPVKEFPADWKLGRGAGHIRNTQMANYSDTLIAFWDGKSKGTKHMIETAREKGLSVNVCRY